MQDGGIVERNDLFDFEAPTDGYQTAVEVVMPTTAKSWASEATNDYFAKLSDGKFARFSINFYAGDRTFVVIETFLNPIAGSRILEPN